MLKTVQPHCYHRHALDLRRCARLLERQGLAASAEHARHLALAAESAHKLLRSERQVQHFCAVCGAPVSPRAYTCGSKCRARASRGPDWISEAEAYARSLGLPLRDFWGTPPALIKALTRELGPCGLDAAATAFDTVAQRYLSPLQDAMKTPWTADGWVWCNPPYSRAGGGLLAWLHRARDQAQEQGVLVVVLAPPGVGSTYRIFATRAAHEIRDLPRRLAFLDPLSRRPVAGNREGSSLFVFRPDAGPAKVALWDFKS